MAKKKQVRVSATATKRPRGSDVSRSQSAEAGVAQSGDAGDKFNFTDDIVVPVMVSDDPVLVEQPLTPRQKMAILAMAPDLYRVCLAVRASLSGGEDERQAAAEMLDGVLARTIPHSL